jgi:holo-[acyl-carrier protein] synthase
VTAPERGEVVAVGVDLASIEELRQAINQFGERYLHRLFTERELAECQSRADPAPHLAARFAAKEATFKALRLEGPQPPWTSIEVYSDQDGRCELRLTGAAAALASERGIAKLVVSLTHEGDMAAAVVVGSPPEPGLPVVARSE